MICVLLRVMLTLSSMKIRRWGVQAVSGCGQGLDALGGDVQAADVAHRVYRSTRDRECRGYERQVIFLLFWSFHLEWEARAAKVRPAQ